MKIPIGADELILWLRKNKKAENETTVNNAAVIVFKVFMILFFYLFIIFCFPV